MGVGRRIGVALFASLALALSACTSLSGPTTLVVWTGDTLPDRVAATRTLIERFTQQTGIRVNLVSVDEDQFATSLTQAAASGHLPDVVASQPLSAIRTLETAQLLDTQSAQDVVSALGPGTFDEHALEWTSDGPEQLAVPSDGWTQLIYYRKDLFAAKGLASPDSFANVANAARALQSTTLDGFIGPTVPGDNFTQQVFEEFALANGCQLVDAANQVSFDSPPCISALSYYQGLVAPSRPGPQDVNTVRAAYFTGRAAMIAWSTFLLDELAGLRDDTLPACPECQADPMFLAHNTGVVTGLSGPYGTQPAHFGEINSWAILVDSQAGAARQFVAFMMDTGYLDWLAQAPEGRVPSRLGPKPGSTEYIDAWRRLPIGVDREAPLADLYPPDVVRAVEDGTRSFQQWKGDLVGASLSELPVAAAVHEVVEHGGPASTAAAKAANDLRSIQRTLPR